MLGFIKKGYTSFKRIIIIGMVIMVVFNVFLASIAHTIHDGIPTEEIVANSRTRLYTAINDSRHLQSPEQKLNLAFYRGLLCQMLGETCSKDPNDTANNTGDGLLAKSTELISMPFMNPPASGVQATYAKLQNIGLVPKTYAAEGIGFAALAPFMNIWKIFRDISLMVLVLIMFAIGFMIMFRTKINPQTVISVENALPRIAISMILITFSYAIAGFLIDIMYVVIALFIGLLSNNNANYSIAQMQDKYLNSGFGTIWDSLFPQQALYSNSWLYQFLNTAFPFLGQSLAGFSNLILTGMSFLQILPKELYLTVQLLAYIPAIFGAEKLLSILNNNGTDILNNISVFAESAGSFPGAVIKIVSSILIFLILPVIMLPLILGILVFFTILFVIFRIFFMLLFTYIRILLFVILGPVFVLFNAIPGRDTFSYWLKSLIAELATFPVVIAIFLVSQLIMKSLVSMSNITIPNGNFWMPPFLYGLNQDAFIFLTGLGLVFITPDLVKVVKELFGVKPLPSLFGIGTFFGGVTAAVGGAVTLGTSLQSLKGLWKTPGMGEAGIFGKAIDTLTGGKIKPK